MAGNAHYDAGSVAHEDIVGNEHGQHLMRNGVFHLDTVKADACFVLIQLAALKIGLSRGFLLISLYLVPVFDLVLPLVKHRMLGGNDHVSSTEQGIGTGGVYGDLAADIGLKRDLGTGGAADPVALLNLYALDVINIIQIVDKALSIFGYAQHPLAFFLADDFAAAALADAVNYLFVCKDALAGGAPVDGHGRLVCKAVLIHLEEYPLRPLIILGVGGIDAAIPVKAVAEHFQLAGKVSDIVFGDYCRMDMVFDCVVFRRQAESVKAYREQDIVALHALFTGDYIKSGERSGVADMKALTRRVRELDQSVELGTGSIASNCRIGFCLFPDRLPLLFNCCKIVFHLKFNSLIVLYSCPNAP